MKMDPLDEAGSKTSKSDREVELRNNCQNSKKQGNESDEKLFISMSHAHENVRLSLNGPTRVFNNITNNDHQNQTNKHNYATEQCVGVQQERAINVINSSIEQFNVPSSSKCEANVGDNGLAHCSNYQSCSKYMYYMDKSDSCNLNTPSTSGVSAGKAWDGLQENTFKENRKRPSSLKLNRPNIDDDSSSDTGNDDYSLGSEDGCIYTYRGGEHLADLPSSFFSLDMGLPLDKHLPIPPNYPIPQQAAANVREQGSRVSSPDMDFLEMDFDPGPSCEVDTGDESSPDADLEVVNMPEEIEPVIRGTSPEYLPGAIQAQVIPQPHLIPQTSSNSDKVEDFNNVPSTSKDMDIPQGEDNTKDCQTYGPYITHVNARGEQFLVKRTMAQCPVNVPVTMHVSSGDLVSPREILNYDEEHSEGAHAYQINQGERSTFDSANLSSALYHVTMAKRLMSEKTKADNESDVHSAEKPASTSTDCSVNCVEPPRCMVWSEREACERQVTQIGTSACGATAVVNVFIALGVPVNIERINLAVGTRQRANNAPLPRYLLSRAVAGCTAADMVTGIQKASEGLVTARFFPTYPERVMSLSHWLADWISLGAVPILTLNLQKGHEGSGELPDAWHHQMVWGVSARGVFLSNPAECVSEAALWPRLASPSELLVRVRDALARFTPSTDLTPLAAVPHRAFRDLNVLGQVVNAIREWRSTGWSEYGTRTRYIRIPAAYQAGVTVAALTGSEAHRRLMHAPLPPALTPHPPTLTTHPPTLTPHPATLAPQPADSRGTRPA